jgi:hypothetical protein
MMNLASNWWKSFAHDLWNWLDAVVVMISIAGLMIKEGLGALSVLRIARVLKMVKLFRSLNQLRIMIDALSSAVLPVLNAFVLVALVSSIYAIVGTDLFQDLAPEYFGNFSTSLFTFVECATESWAVAAREIMHNPESTLSQPLVACIFISYVLIVGVVLINVVVAVLLDEFLSCVSRYKEEEQAIKDNIVRDAVDSKLGGLMYGPIDALLRGLMDFQSEQELHALILKLYVRIDIDESGTVSREEINQGLKKVDRSLHITEEEFVYMLQQAKLPCSGAN